MLSRTHFAKYFKISPVIKEFRIPNATSEIYLRRKYKENIRKLHIKLQAYIDIRFLQAELLWLD